jgi:hypothetical protein
MGVRDVNGRAYELVEQLRSFRTRKEAMESLLMMGQDAVPSLVHALGHVLENVRWAAGQVLSQIGGDEAVQQLIAALDDSRRAEAAAEVLSKITGQTFGKDRSAWSEWARRSPDGTQKPAAGPTPPQPELETPSEPEPEPAPEPEEPEAPPESEPLPDKELVEAAVSGTEISVRERTGGFVLSVPIARGRTQRVILNFTAKDFEDEALIVVYTECGPANPSNYEWALRQNVRMSFGSIGVRDRAGQPTFVMVDTHHRATVAPAELRKSILLLAKRGDGLEDALTQADQR